MCQRAPLLVPTQTAFNGRLADQEGQFRDAVAPQHHRSGEGITYLLIEALPLPGVGSMPFSLENPFPINQTREVPPELLFRPSPQRTCGGVDDFLSPFQV